MPKAAFRDEREFLRGFASKLKSTATRPTIYGYEPYIDPHTGQSPQLRFHSCQKKGRLFIGGNRSGKTVSGATEAIMWLIGQHRWIKTPEPPVRGRCVSVDFTNGVEKIVKPEVARWIPPSALKNGSWEASFDKETKTLHLDNGSFLEFMSYDQDVDKFAGTSRHFIWFDEEPPEEIFDECMMRLIDTGGHWWLTMTPVEGMTWVYEDIYVPGFEKGDDHIEVIVVDSEMNPYVSATEREILFSFLTDDEKKARQKGTFVQLGGLVYPMFKEELHVIPYFVPPKEWLWVRSMDHGFTNPTSWHWSAIDPEGRVFVFDEYYQSGKVVAEHAAAVHGVTSKYQREPNYSVGDPSIRNTDPITGTSVLLEYMDFGIPIVLGNHDQKAGINRVARYFLGRTIEEKQYPMLFICDNNVELIRELKRLRWATWANKKDDKKKNKKEEQHKKDDHACDDLRYLISSRPEMDDGRDVPETPRPPVGVSESVPASGEWYDKELVSGSSGTQWHDPYLGSDF